MIGRNEQTSVNDSSAPGEAHPATGTPAGAPASGATAGRLPPEAERSAQEAAPEPGRRSGVERAEEMANHLAERVGALTSFATRKLVVLAHRAREAAQDFWADVQDFRHGERP
jgi:hypothetical protein